jgi:N-methylhydantoinase B
MSNTRNTPIEVLEMECPLRVRTYALRPGSGGTGRWTGGDGVVREFEVLAPMTAAILAERRRHPPRGVAGGRDALPGETLLNGVPLAPKVSTPLVRGDILRIATPGGGGWGDPERGDER